jgi:hypothetical protein
MGLIEDITGWETNQSDGWLAVLLYLLSSVPITLVDPRRGRIDSN